MPVKDELVGLDRRAAANLKAKRHAEALPSMTRPWTADGVRYTINSFSAPTVNGVTMLKVIATARVAPNGEWIIPATDPLNPMFFINPPIMVPDGEETNPDYDPNRTRTIQARDDQGRFVAGTVEVSDPGPGRPTRTKFKEDMAEAFRQMIQAKVRDRA